jgi:sulfur-carrier protein
MSQTPTITLHVPGPLRPASGGAAELSLQATTVRAALQVLEQSQPELYRGICDETGAVRRHLNIFVNTDHMRERDGLDTALANGDEVTILPAVSGG